MPTKLFMVQTIFWNPEMYSYDDDILEERALYTNEEFAKKGFKKKIEDIKHLGGTKCYTDEIIENHPDDCYKYHCSNRDLVGDAIDRGCIYCVSLQYISDDIENDCGEKGFIIWSEF